MKHLLNTLNKIKGLPISSFEPFVVLSTQLNQTVATEHWMCSLGGMACIALDVV
jgi:hypothetical protein